ncbi:hypothetical protein [Verminephrobacter aporrectodeae]|uniref:hypothetical protein n=1 Tax=Verminephrobacter aporrectodeae TaxID=1110389 RepID=UPI0003178DA5|nr:hypothetical protein [Verminephrobacter aporrectodeae]
MNARAFLKFVAAASLCLAGLGAQAQPYTVGASLLTQQHPFYVELAQAMRQQAAKEGVRLDLSIANQDLNKQLSDVEDFVSKKSTRSSCRRSIPRGSRRRC